MLCSIMRTLCGFSLQTSGSALQENDESIGLPTLAFVAVNGNCTMQQLYEGRDGLEVEITGGAATEATGSAGDPPLTIDFGEEPTIDFGGLDEEEPGIDFGGLDEEEPQIDFGGLDEEPGIDFGGLDEEPGIDFGDEIDFGEGEAQIDFGITADDGGIDWSAAFVCEASGTEKKKLDAKEANNTVLDTDSSRTEIENELIELFVFLEQRSVDMNSKSTAQSFSQLQKASNLVQQTGVEHLAKWLEHLQQIMGVMNSASTRQLIQINASSGHVDRLAVGLALKRQHMKRFLNQAKEQDAKEQVLQESLREHRQSLKALVTKVAETKTFLETTLAAQKGFENCRIQLVGAINSVR